MHNRDEEEAGEGRMDLTATEKVPTDGRPEQGRAESGHVVNVCDPDKKVGREPLVLRE